jgi:hypothetical protein
LEGRFNPDGFGDISGIAVDSSGRVWVNDVATGFKRNSVWSSDGKLVKQWFCRKIQQCYLSRHPGLLCTIIRRFG